VLSSVLAAAGGIVYMLIYNGSTLAVTAPNFTLALLLMVVIGGAGSRWGAVLGGILYTYMNDRLIAIGSSSTVEGLPHALRTPLEQPLFLLGIVFILIVVFLPGGLTGLVHRGRPSGLRRIESAVLGEPAAAEDPA
jgi:branched-chain amino acid transport system permease protein